MPKKSTKSRDKTDSGVAFQEEPLSSALLEKVMRAANKPLRMDDFLRILALPRREKKALELYLHEMTASERAFRLGGGAYTLASALKTVRGVLAVQRSGVGFVRPESASGSEIFISRPHLGQAWHGDRVEVAVFPGRHGKNRDGRITRVLERAVTELPARVVRTLKDGTVVCEPMDMRITAVFLTDVSALEAAPARNALVRIRPLEFRGPDLWTAEALALLGDEDDPAVQEDLVKANHGIPRAFPPDAVREAAAFTAHPDREDVAGRVDLASLPFVTIDGAFARDFDDAVHVARDKDGGYLLHVAIADVAHYVRPGSALDKEALARGNSYYFPRSVEPMLPETLSNELCSLNPGVPRLVMVAEIHFSAQGKPLREVFYPARIVSAARLTYDQVRDALIDGTREARDNLGPNLPMMETALALAHILDDARKARGNLDFELPEPECLFDAAGNLTALAPRDNHFAHTLIEVFMVAANEAVARFLTAREVPLLYRAHPAPDPDKLRGLFQILTVTGLLPPSMAGISGRNAPAPSPRQLQALLDGAKGSPHEYLVSRVALRAMMQAGYTPEREGHFGLASECYCHFTSPIRRYADLVVHRSLKAALDAPDKTRLPGRKSLQSIADHINTTERTAMDAEREIYRRMGVLFMSAHVGEEYEGVVSGLTEFGIFVEIGETMTEGMIRLADMNDDYYVHFPEQQELRGERTGRVFRLGQQVTVTVADVRMARLEITLAFARDGERRGMRRSGRAKAGQEAVRGPALKKNAPGTRKGGKAVAKKRG